MLWGYISVLEDMSGICVIAAFMLSQGHPCIYAENAKAHSEDVQTWVSKKKVQEDIGLSYCVGNGF